MISVIQGSTGASTADALQATADLAGTVFGCTPQTSAVLDCLLTHFLLLAFTPARMKARVGCCAPTLAQEDPRSRP